MRTYSCNKSDYLVLYTFAPEGYNLNEYIREDLESFGMDTRSCKFSHNRNRLRIGWKDATAAWEAAAIYLSSETLKQEYKLGPCYLKVQRIQQNMQRPQNFATMTLDDRMGWIHRAIRGSMESVCPRNRTKKRARNHSAIDEKYLEIRHCSQLIKLLQNVTRFSQKSSKYRRSLGQLRQKLGNPYIGRQATFRRYLSYYENRKKFLLKQLKSVKYRKLKGTKSALGNTGLRTKRVFDDVLSRQPFSTRLPAVEENEIDYVNEEEKLLKLFENWVPPLEHPERLEDSPPGNAELQLEHLKAWLQARKVSIDESILEELTPRPYVVESMWSNLCKPVTVPEIRKACRNKKSAPGRTRVTHRMVLYAHEQIQNAISEVLTDIISTGKVPDVFKVALLRPIPKEVGKPVQDAARPIVLLECIWKILTAILSNRLQTVLEDNQLLYPASFGFLHGKRIQDALHIKMALEELGRESAQSRYSLELDVSKAYDHCRGHTLDICCSRFKLPETFCKLVQNMRCGARNLLMHEGRILGSIEYNTLRQGDPLSCLLYVMCMDPLMHVLDRSLAGVTVESKKGKSRLTGVIYADDITTYHESVTDVEKSLAICDEYFSLNQQKINPKKSILRVLAGDRASVAFRGIELTTVTGSHTSRYLGLHYAPDGTVHGLRQKIKEILQRLQQQLRAKICSSQLRSLIVNMVVIPKLTYLCSASCWRIHDLDYMRDNLKKLFDCRLDDSVLYASCRSGGAGLVDIARHGAEQFIFHFFRAVTDTTAITRGIRLLNRAKREIPNEVEFRRRQLQINSWRSYLFDCLIEREQKRLRTEVDPLALPVNAFENDRKATLSLVNTCREYLTFLNLQAVPLGAGQATQPDIYQVLPPQEAYKITHKTPERWMLAYSDNCVRLGPEIIKDGWKVNFSNTKLRQGSRFVNALLGLHFASKIECWKFQSLPLTRLPSLALPQFNNVVVYQVRTIVLNGRAEVWPQLGVVVDLNTGGETIGVSPLKYNWQMNVNQEMKELTAVTDQLYEDRRDVNRQTVLMYGNVRSIQCGSSYTVTIHIPSWRRDCVLLVNEWILCKLRTDRRKIEDARMKFLRVTQGNSERLQSQFAVFTDGSCTNDEDSYLLGAGAVIRTLDKTYYHYYTQIPSMTGSLWPAVPSSLYAEIAGAALGGWVMMTRFQRACSLTTDNQSLQRILNNPSKWPDLHKHGGFFGALLQLLLETQVIKQAAWIRAHQRDTSISGVWENQLADQLAELSRRQSTNTGNVLAAFIELPLWHDSKYIVAPLQPSMQLCIPHNRNKALSLTTIPLPSSEWMAHGPTCLRSLQLTRRLSEQGRSASRLPDDTPEVPMIRLSAMRIRSGMAPLTWETILQRPDIYSKSPACPSCRKSLTYANSRVAIWRHILFECSSPEIRKNVDIQLHLIDHQYLVCHQLRLHRAQPKEKALLQILLHRDESTRKRRTCSNCSTYQLIDAEGKRRNGGLLLLERYGLLDEWKAQSYSSLMWTYSSYVLVINPSFYIRCRELFQNAQRVIYGGYVGCNPPDSTMYQYWICPFSRHEEGNKNGLSRACAELHHSGWAYALSWEHLESWWTSAIYEGNQCHHAPSVSIPSAALILFSLHADPPPPPLRLADLRPLWKQIFLDSSDHCSVYIPSSDDLSLAPWIHGVPRLDQIRHSQTMGQHSFVLPWSYSAPVNDADALHWWLGNTPVDRVHWYLGLHSTAPVQAHSIRMYDKLNKVLHKAQRDFNASHGITYDILWDQQHLREFENDLDETAFINLTETQKCSYRRVLSENRRLRATNQSSKHIRSSLPARTPPLE
jgi:hypothetical protein